MKFLILLLIPILVFAQNIPSDQVKIGRPQTSADKELIFDTNDGVSNKKLSVEKSSKRLKWNGNSVQIGDGAATDKEILINGTLGKGLKYDSASSQFEFNDDLGINGFSLKSNTIVPFSGTETSIEQDARVKGKLNIGTSTNEIRVSGGNLEFSNDGVIYKKVGSGSGGGEGGLNLALNPSFEDGAGNWTATGGTYSIQPYSQPSENNLSYARFISSGAGQTLCSDAIIVPDFLTGGCLAYAQYKTTSNNDFELQVLSASSVINKASLVTTEGKWLQTQPVPLLCPDAGQNIQVCFNSLSAATIEVDQVYKGSENRVVKNDCQGIAACETVFSAKVSSTGVVSGENLDWINGNCVITGSAATSVITCTYNSGIFTQAANCFASTNFNSSGSERGLVVDSSSSTTVGIRNFVPSGNNTYSWDQNITLSCQKQGADFAAAKPQTAVTNQQSAWFIDANIGGGNPDLGATNISSYTEITNPSLDMVINPGSASAKIPCSSTNGSTGLTCSSGDESLGIVFTPPYSGYFDACFSFGHFNDSAVNAAATVTFQAILTQNSSQIIIQEGKSRVPSAHGVGGAGSSTSKPNHVCGTFLFSDTSEKTIRVMREQAISGAIGTNIILADRDAAVGQRDIRVTVRPSTMNVARPVLTGDTVTSPNNNRPVLFGANISAAGVVTNNVEGIITTANCNLGTYVVNHVGLSAVRFCTYATTDASEIIAPRNFIATSSTITFVAIARGGAGVCVPIALDCRGVR